MRFAIITLILTIQMASSTTLDFGDVQDKGKCIALLEKILVEAYGTYKDVETKDYAKMIGDVIALGQDVVADIKCFKEQNIKEVLEGAITRYTDLSGDTSDCIVDHLQTVLGDMKDMLKELFEGDWKGVEDSYNKVMDTFNDIKNC